MGYDPALESIFASAEQQAASLIDNIATSINEKINDIDSAEELVLKLSNEAARFNKILVSLDNAKSQLESGDITKEQCLEIVTPFVNELKSQCTALGLSGAELSEDEDIDTQEIAVLREIIIGAKAAAEARVVELRTDADLSPDTESFDEIPFNLFDDNEISEESVTASDGMQFDDEDLDASIAEEAMSGRMFSALANNADAKVAKTLMRNAKKLYHMGSYQKAIDYMKKAQSLYQKCLDKVKKNTKWVTSERKAVNVTAGISDTYKKEVTEDVNSATLVRYFEDRVDTCKAYCVQWANRSKSASIKDLKEKLKAERKEEKQKIREQRKAQRASESYNMEVNTMDARQFYAACESYVGNLDNELNMMCLENYEAIPEISFTDAMEAAKTGRMGGIQAKLDEAKAYLKDPKNAWKVITISLGIAVACLAIVYAIQKKTGKQPWTTSVLNACKKSVDKIKALRQKAKDKKNASKLGSNDTASYPKQEAEQAYHEALAAALNTKKLEEKAAKARVEIKGSENHAMNNDGTPGETRIGGGGAPKNEPAMNRERSSGYDAPKLKKNASQQTREIAWQMDNVGESFNLFDDEDGYEASFESVMMSIFDD